MNSKPDSYSIGDLAREFAVTTRTIRYCEDAHKLSLARSGGHQRVFGQRDRVRLKLILRGKRLGFALAEIRKIIDLSDAAPGEAGQLRLLLEKIADRRRELEDKRRDLDASLADLDRVAAHCRISLTDLTGEREIA